MNVWVVRKDKINAIIRSDIALCSDQLGAKIKVTHPATPDSRDLIL